MIDYCFEKELKLYSSLSNIDFIGQSYLIANNIHPNWFPLFRENQHLLCSIFQQLDNILFYPEHKNIFNAFKIDPKFIKVILLGQDPYINKNQAHGLSFSVQNNCKIPPSLVNIFKELNNEYKNKYNFVHGNLQKWHDQGIFLLNSALTVLPGVSNSHADLWKEFTDNVIYYLSENYENKIFLLFGRFAQSKSILITEEKHKIISCTHPSPLSANNGFFGSNVFIEVNKSLKNLKKQSINWQN
jgi:uracil-DNA glycosylase